MTQLNNETMSFSHCFHLIEVDDIFDRDIPNTRHANSLDYAWQKQTDLVFSFLMSMNLCVK